MELEKENKIKEEAEKMEDKRLLDELAHCHVMIKSNLLGGYQDVDDCKQKLKTLEEEVLKRMKSPSTKT